MSNPFADSNPYASPSPGVGAPETRRLVMRKVTAPAIGLVVVGSLGLIVSLFNVGYAVTQQPAQIDPAAPEWLRAVQEGSLGVFPAVVQGGFALFNLLIVIGAAQMMRLRTWGFALAASIMTMIDCTSGCCIMGLPIGIWSAIILSQTDVQAAFRAASHPER